MRTLRGVTDAGSRCGLKRGEISTTGPCGSRLGQVRVARWEFRGEYLYVMAGAHPGGGVLGVLPPPPF